MFRERLEQYAVAEVDDGQRLVCRSAPACRSSTRSRGTFAPGQLSYVGSHYGAEDQDGLRVLVVGKQTGRGDEHVTMTRRAEQVASAKPRSASPFPRTPHMSGTAAALKVLLGAAPDGDDALRGVHVFDRFALVNATLCSHIPRPHDAKGEGTETMYERCSVHLRRTIELLEPTVIVAQGWTKSGSSPSSVVAAALRVEKPTLNSEVLVRAQHGPVGFAALVHPSMNWSSPRSTKFREVVEPTLRRTRQVVLAELAGTAGR